MKSYLKIALIAALAMLPSSFSFAAVSAAVSDGATQLVSQPANTQVSSALVAALVAEIKSQGLGNVSAIAQEVISKATNDENAAALAAAIATAAMIAGQDLNADLTAIASDVQSGITAGTTFSDAALSAANDAMVAQGGEGVLPGSGGDTVDVPVAGGDADITPSVDVSNGTGVGN